ncbi:very short patch repair endonuclease [Variovorax sp. VaC1]|uniref:very short patch repair endonuclease n=1 Tax=Variovorax sp. VaC1 TaxID=3373132 RepID=UPI003748D299
MVDIVNPSVRSRMMAGIKGKNNKTEILVRHFLHSRGYRFRLHRKDLPGRPDLVLPKYRLAIFVNGCFWHRHAECAYATSPSTRTDFWAAKLDGNAERDKQQREQLVSSDWRVLTIWECGLKHAANQLIELEALIQSKEIEMEWPLLLPKPRPSRI